MIHDSGCDAHSGETCSLEAGCVMPIPAAEAYAYRRWQTAVARYRSCEEALRAAKQEADAAVVELASFAMKDQSP